MKKFAIYETLALLIISSMFITGCEAIGNIFSAGVWIGLTIALVVIIVLVSIFRGRKD